MSLESLATSRCGLAAASLALSAIRVHCHMYSSPGVAKETTVTAADSGLLTGIPPKCLSTPQLRA